MAIIGIIANIISLIVDEYTATPLLLAIVDIIMVNADTESAITIISNDAGIPTSSISLIMFFRNLKFLRDMLTNVSFFMSNQYIITIALNSEDKSDAIAAPATPHFSMYMNIGSNNMFAIADIAITIVALSISPSPRSIPLAPEDKKNMIIPAKDIVL